MQAESHVTSIDPIDRDPRQAPWGIYTGGSFVLDSVRVLLWFETQTELAVHILEQLPEVYDFDAEAIAAYRTRVEPIMQRVKEHGLTEELLAEVNAAIKDDMVIDWWGHFDELVAAKSEFAQQVVGNFRGDGKPIRSVRADELDAFVGYLKTYGF